MRQSSGKFKIALLQMRCSPDTGANLARAIGRVEEAAQNGAQVICLPELFRSQYFCQREDPALFDLAEPIPGPTTEALSAAARERRVAVVAPLFERRAAGVYYNSVAVIDADGSIVNVYRKTHIPDDPLYYE
ncbi:MAG TPA: nitrilase-related carbon-nitrogen hydrolase, partial [Bryobacterales bacterium]|nr:nitrilase-related carbon-nitrogen hydrolase [Bryobacterales bacterium]